MKIQELNLIAYDLLILPIGISVELCRHLGYSKRTAEMIIVVSLKIKCVILQTDNLPQVKFSYPK